jgi:imidazole glycerol-phosphate synthase subunit HisH
MSVAIVNYGMGNLASVRRAFQDLGQETFIAVDPKALGRATHVVLPGVGAFGDGMRSLRDGGWVSCLEELANERRVSLLGICLGMQMLAARSFEGEETLGLALIPGDVRRLSELGCGLRIPHVGWNEVRLTRPDVLFEGIPSATDFYFVHSYAFVPARGEHLLATTPYDTEFAAAVRKDNVFGCQFHPEKSSKAGRRVLKNFASYGPCRG